MFMTTDVRARRGWKSILFLAINNSNEWIGDGYLSTHHSTLGSNSNICFAFILLREITVAGADTSRMPVQDRVLLHNFYMYLYEECILYAQIQCKYSQTDSSLSLCFSPSLFEFRFC